MRFIFAALLLTLGAPLAAQAQQHDNCSDVLRDGTFKLSTYRENSFFQQLIYSRFAKSSYEESKSDKSFGLDVPIGDIVFGGNYTDKEFDQKKNEIRAALDVDTTSRREIDIALSSGDPEILKAWRDCMAKKRGVSARFDVYSATKAALVIEYFAFPGVPETILTDSISLSNDPLNKVVVLGQAKCLKAGYRLKDQIACKVPLELPSAKSTILVVAATQHGTAEAFLAKRLRPVKEVRKFEADLHVFRSAEGGSAYPTIIAELPGNLIKLGFYFQAKTATSHITVQNMPNGGHCEDQYKRQEVTPFHAWFDFWWLNNSKQGLECHLNAFLSIERVIWVPID